MGVDFLPMRTSCYARFSSDLQRLTSLDDQLRACREYAARHDWTWQDQHVYTDAGISGSSIEGRSGLQALLSAAATAPRPFDVLLVDDSSRVARDLADAVRILQQLKFLGIRAIYISQHIDSADEQAELLLGFHGLIDSVYIKEMAAKIRRGLAGQLTRGYATGGVTYGYRTVAIPDPNRTGEKIGCRIEIEPTEAAVVGDVFGWYAAGISIPTIITKLHEHSASPPRGGSSKGAWRIGSVRRMLANERYRGRQIWGQRRTERKPGSRAKVQRRLPESEWHVVERPALRIIDEDLWQRVQLRRQRIAELATNHRQSGRTLLRGKHQGLHGRSIFSGLIACGACGKLVGIVSNHTVKGVNYRYYGCAHAMRNGSTACSNRVNVRADIAEQELLGGLQAELLKPETLAYITDQLANALRAAVDQRPAQRADLLHQQDELGQKMRNLLAVVENGDAPATVLAAMRDREAEAARLDAELRALATPVDEGRLAVMPSWVKQQLGSVAELLEDRPDEARAEFERMGLRFTFEPVYDVPEGQKPYLRATGEGDFSLLALGAHSPFPITGASHLR